MSDDPKTIFVVPVPGGIVRLPGSRQALPAEGAEVPNDPFWNRRLLHGDVVLKAVELPTEEKIAASTRKGKKISNEVPESEDSDPRGESR